MGIQIAPLKTPRGLEIIRSLTSGPVSAEDVRMLLSQVDKGGPLFGKPLVSVIESDTTYSPEARMLVRNIDSDSMPDTASAIVVKSAPQRIVLGFMLRLSSRKNALRVFGKEEEAVKWVEDQLLSKAPAAAAAH